MAQYYGSFTGWQKYPHNLAFPALDVDASRCHESLSKDAARLFIPDGELSRLQMLDLTSRDGHNVGPDQVIIESSEQLEICLQRPSHTWVFQVAQAYSWGQLPITEEMFRKLLTSMKVHPGFLDVVHVFGEKITTVEESFAAFFTRIFPGISDPQSINYEIAYNIKYVTRHGRNFPLDPFSIRETGVYHKSLPDSGTSNWILLSPSDALSERLAKVFQEMQTSDPLQQMRCHALIFLCLSENWRDYVNYLEDNFSKLMDRGFFSNLRKPARPGKIDADFGDIRSLQIMTDKLKKLIHLLNLNKALCNRLQLFFERVKLASSQNTTILFCQHETMMENYLFQNETHTSQLKSIVSRGEGVGSLIQHILDIRATETSHNMNSAMHNISKQGAEENKLVRQLTLKSTQDTRSMRVIALISAVFLPATFVATFFGSNFFGYEETKNGHSLTVASNIWIYVVTALTISVVTVSLWYWWCSRYRSTMRLGETFGSEMDKSIV
ncbi:hypothetical protein DL98DRAFT_658401 [Cadophora sp. DSE1049]|nr:hypothetical protein DL98DRAFT_658401 [Cadophora sp. DSE1049]